MPRPVLLPVLALIAAALAPRVQAASSAPAREGVPSASRRGEGLDLTGWVRTPPPGAPTATAHLTVRNGTRATVRLLGASSPDFERVEVHAMDMAGGVMRMRPVTAPLEVKAGGVLALDGPSGLHLMLIGPRRPLAAGGRVRLALRFSPGGVRTVEAPVGPRAPGGPA